MARARRDYYEVLGVPRGADRDEIQRAFRRLARRLHPDVAPSEDAADEFREVAAAYNVLSRPRSRFMYDRFGYRGGGGFEEGAPLGPPRILGEVELEELEAERGTRRQVSVGDPETCPACGGSGGAGGAEPEICETCSGKGTVRVSAGMRAGRWLQVEPCPDCGGDGRFQTPCPECGGLGEVERSTRTITVRIPPGVKDGTRLRVAGEDEHAYLVVNVRPAPRDSRVVQVAAAVLLLAALVLLVYLLVWA